MLSPNTATIIQQNTQQNIINSNNTQQRMSSSQQEHLTHPVATSAAADMGTGLNNCRCRNFYLQKGENKCYLFAMAFGATRDGLVDVDFLDLSGGDSLTKQWYEFNDSHSHRVDKCAQLCTTIDCLPTCCFTINHKATSARVHHHNRLVGLPSSIAAIGAKPWRHAFRNMK